MDIRTPTAKHDRSTSYPMETTHLMETAHRGQPLRYLDPEVARSIGDAKNRTGMSWRHLARLTGVSHPHLVLLAQGRRVPSLYTADRIISVLPMTLKQGEALRAVAVADRGKSRPR